MHVALIGVDLHQRMLFEPFAAAVAQIVVHLVLQKLAHRVAPVLVFHNHQCRVLRHGFAQ